MIESRSLARPALAQAPHPDHIEAFATEPDQALDRYATHVGGTRTTRDRVGDLPVPSIFLEDPWRATLEGVKDATFAEPQGEGVRRAAPIMHPPGVKSVYVIRPDTQRMEIILRTPVDRK